MIVAMPRLRRLIAVGCSRRLVRDERGMAMLEFALALPMLLGLILGAMEMSNYIIANNTVQRLATASADMLSQTGVDAAAPTEAKIYDMFYALDVAAKPLDMRNHGRIIVTVVKGVATGGSVKNQFADTTFSQQFDGGYTAAVPLLGCHTTVASPIYSRTLPKDEIMVHAQVSYEYQPLLPGVGELSYFAVPPVITRTAVFRMRKHEFSITNDGNLPVKNKCNTKTGT